MSLLGHCVGLLLQKSVGRSPHSRTGGYSADRGGMVRAVSEYDKQTFLPQVPNPFPNPHKHPHPLVDSSCQTPRGRQLGPEPSLNPSTTWPSRASRPWQACTSRALLESRCVSTETPATVRIHSTGSSWTTTTRTRYGTHWLEPRLSSAPHT